MSFADVNMNTLAPPPDPLATSLFQLSQQVNTFDSLVQSLGTPHDTLTLRSQLSTKTLDISEAIKALSHQFKTLPTPTEPFPKLARSRLQKDFESLLARFQALSKKAAQRSRDYIAQAHQALAKQESSTFISFDIEEPLETQPLLQQQTAPKLLLADADIAYNEALIEEREQDLVSIEKSVAQVNEIFRDLGTLVHEQQ